MNIFVIILNDFFFNWGFEFGSGLMAKNVPTRKTKPLFTDKSAYSSYQTLNWG